MKPTALGQGLDNTAAIRHVAAAMQRSPAASIPTSSATIAPTFLTFWGKAQSDAQSRDAWHPVAYHCLDVAACVERILSVRPLARRQAESILQSEISNVSALLTALVALHDIGKFASFFQAKRPDLWPRTLGEPPRDMPKTYHTRDGLLLWNRSLRQRIGNRLWLGDVHDFTPIVQSVMGHHGRPIGTDPRRDILDSIYHPTGRDAAEAFADAVIELLMPRPFDGAHLREEELLRATWWIAGLVTTADWIGSNERWFPYTAVLPDDQDLRAYWTIARTGAAAAVRDAGLEPPAPARYRSFVELTGRETPTPAQRWAAEVALTDRPTLFIIEDVTGAGKTEAAQILIHRLMSSGRASGAFWAMPTQATANAMYDRQSRSIRALFDPNAAVAPSLVLAHSQSRMHEGFRATVIEEPRLDQAVRRENEADAPSETSCAAFLANRSRASLIADVGAGTVDQAILSVLPSKFNTMRLFGLSEKILVLDEIHAYDSYMVEELRALLRFHAELGGSVIALSATLPSKLMADLVGAWRLVSRSSCLPPDAAPLDASYPLATVVTTDGTVAQTPVEPTPWSRRTVPVRLVDDVEDVLATLLEASRGGAAAVWIRNTVDSCREGAELLRQRGAANVSVFHARFAQFDRQKREHDVLVRFGPADHAHRAGTILVATQVVEQSLDLDFDVMVSDLAPVDLLIQRSGRLWRHSFRTRPAAARKELVVLSPFFDENPETDWLDQLLPNTRWVYRDSGLLWRTLRTLVARGEIVAPDGLRALISAVYDDDECPSNLQSMADRVRGDQLAAMSTARQYALNIGDGYVGESLIWSSDVRVPTRLDDHYLTIRLGRLMEDGSIRPWADPAEPLPPWHQWALSEVRVSKNRVPPKSSPDAAFRAACDAVRATWGRWDQEVPLIPLRFDGSVWSGGVVRPDGDLVHITYDSVSGLSLSRRPERSDERVS